mmetsp:Transcript_76994/g.214037  ORF Transcript_76994/g.214037 Transcript_76994/m.214037 type:complete len:454 (-) Transcript_76994:1011-2372(-)
MDECLRHRHRGRAVGGAFGQTSREAAQAPADALQRSGRGRTNARAHVLRLGTHGGQRSRKVRRELRTNSGSVGPKCLHRGHALLLSAGAHSAARATRRRSATFAAITSAQSLDGWRHHERQLGRELLEARRGHAGEEPVPAGADLARGRSVRYRLLSSRCELVARRKERRLGPRRGDRSACRVEACSKHSRAQGSSGRAATAEGSEWAIPEQRQQHAGRWSCEGREVVRGRARHDAKGARVGPRGLSRSHGVDISGLSRGGPVGCGLQRLQQCGHGAVQRWRGLVRGKLPENRRYRVRGLARELRVGLLGQKLRKGAEQRQHAIAHHLSRPECIGERGSALASRLPDPHRAVAQGVHQGYRPADWRLARAAEGKAHHVDGGSPVHRIRRLRCSLRGVVHERHDARGQRARRAAEAVTGRQHGRADLVQIVHAGRGVFGGATDHWHDGGRDALA